MIIQAPEMVGDEFIVAAVDLKGPRIRIPAVKLRGENVFRDSEIKVFCYTNDVG